MCRELGAGGTDPRSDPYLRPGASLARAYVVRSTPRFRLAAWGNSTGKSNRKETRMANPVPAGSDVSAGTYECTNCGNRIEMGSQTHIPPCPSCGGGEWRTVSGGDSVDDPYPAR